MRIVTKTTRDMVPKAIMYLVVNNAKDFINGELLAHLYASGDQVNLIKINNTALFLCDLSLNEQLTLTVTNDGRESRRSSKT